MHIHAALLSIRGSLFLTLFGVLGLASGCGLGFGDPEPQPPADGRCETQADCTGSAPYCAADGACVACLQDDHCAAAPETPVCDQAFSCRACQDHGECASNVCDRDTGACVDESAVAYVAENATGDCSRANPCGSIATALDLVRADNDIKDVIRLDQGTYTEPVLLSDLTVRIIGDDATIQAAGQAPGTPPDPAHDPALVIIGERAQVRLQGVHVRGAPDSARTTGVLCLGDTLSSLRLFQVTVTDNAGLGVLAEDCIFTMERSVITDNAAGGLLIVDSSFEVTNSYFLRNGDVESSIVSGVAIRNEEMVTLQRFAFNTVVDNRAGPEADASGVSCIIHPSGYISASSNIVLVGLGGRRSVGGDCPWTYSNLENMSPINPGGFAYQKNIDRDCMLQARPDGLPTITAGAPCEGRGESDLGILVDYDGNPRDPMAPDMGADER